MLLDKIENTKNLLNTIKLSINQSLSNLYQTTIKHLSIIIKLNKNIILLFIIHKVVLLLYRFFTFIKLAQSRQHNRIKHKQTFRQRRQMSN